MHYFPYGPIDIPRTEGRVARGKNSLNTFWHRVNEEEDGLSEAIGCYIFSIRAGKGVLPWYVGLAEKQTFRKECFTVHKLVNYNESLNRRKGAPVLTLLPKFTSTERYAKTSKNGHKDIQFLENMLVSACLRRNSNLMNIRDTKLLREMTVPGLLNNEKGRNCISVTQFKALIGA